MIIRFCLLHIRLWDNSRGDVLTGTVEIMGILNSSTPLLMGVVVGNDFAQHEVECNRANATRKFEAKIIVNLFIYFFANKHRESKLIYNLCWCRLRGDEKCNERILYILLFLFLTFSFRFNSLPLHTFIYHKSLIGTIMRLECKTNLIFFF